ncbi:TetR family transcriptional regulator [Spirillospora sp. NPDC052242]
MSTPPPEHADRLNDRIDRLPLRERKKLKTRRAIQDHALRLFTEQGYDATTVEQIAAAAEISPSTFFRYFPTKEDVVIDDEYDPVMAEAYRAQPAELSPIDALRTMLAELLPELHGPDLEKLHARLRLITDVPALRARMFESMSTGTCAMLRDVVADRTGRPADDADVGTFAWAVTGVLHAAVYQWLDGSGGSAGLAAVIDRNLEFLGRGCPL